MHPTKQLGNKVTRNNCLSEEQTKLFWPLSLEQKWPKSKGFEAAVVVTINCIFLLGGKSHIGLNVFSSSGLVPRTPPTIHTPIYFPIHAFCWACSTVVRGSLVVSISPLAIEFR